MAETNLIQLGFKVDSPSVPADTFDVVDFEVEEHVSQPFFVRVSLASDDAEIDFDEVANQPATFSVLRFGEPLQFHGVVSRFEQGKQIGTRYLYQVVLVPRLWLLSLRHQSRIFQTVTIDEIVTKVLDDAGFKAQEYRFELESYPVREYVVQFQETDLNFISRLLEHEGIHYYFEYDDAYDVSVLVFSDTTVGKSKPLPGEGTLVYNPGEGLSPAAEAVRVFQCREQLSPGKVFLKEYNYRTPDTKLMAEADVHADLPGLRYEHDQHFKDEAEGKRLVKVRKEEIACHLRVMSGESSYSGLRAGFTFELARHYRSEYNGDYLLLSVKHFGSQAVALPGGLDGGSESIYRNEFTCIPAKVAYRPPRVTPKPRVPGIMTSRTETAGGDYAYVDEDGSYRAKMFFDLSKKTDGEATRPLRMNQPYSGPGYGIHFPNHAGTEMVWACVNGDPDRPLAVGTVPNPSQKSPATSKNKAQSVIRTWGKNELSFDDTIGEENVYLFGTKDHTVEITNDEAISIGNDQSIQVGHDRSKSVGNDQSESVGSNKSITVGKNHTESIGADASIDVGGSETVSVGKNQGTSVGANMSLSVGDNLSASVGKDATRSIGKNAATNVGDSLTVEVGKDGKFTIGKKTSLQSGDDLTVTAQKKMVINVQDELTIKCGKASIILKKNGDIQISGNKINVKGSGDVKIKGSKIAQN